MKNRRMKIKHIIPLCLAFVLLASTTVSAKSVTVTIPDFPVTVNGQTMESTYNQYPLLVYKNITYFPMAYDYARFLGVKANWYQESRGYGNKSVLFVGVAEERAEELKIISTKASNQKRYTAAVADYGIALNTTNPKKYLNNLKEEYPVLNFRGVTYFPLTWRFAVEEFGWEYSYDSKSGLRIESKDPFRPVMEDGIIGSSLPRLVLSDYCYGKEYYAGYTIPFNDYSKLIVRKRGEAEREISLENKFQGEAYLNLRKNSSGVLAEVEPSITGDIFSAECSKYNSVSGEHTVFLLKVNLDTGEVVEEPR